MESFTVTLGNLAYQVQLAALNMKKTELAALSFTAAKLRVLSFKFLRPIHKPEKNTNSELSVAFIVMSIQPTHSSLKFLFFYG